MVFVSWVHMYTSSPTSASFPLVRARAIVDLSPLDIPAKLTPEAEPQKLVSGFWNNRVHIQLSIEGKWPSLQHNMGAPPNVPSLVKGQKSVSPWRIDVAWTGKNAENEWQNDLSKRSFLRRSKVHESVKKRRTVPGLEIMTTGNSLLEESH